MPIYEYVCKEHGVHSIIRRMTEVEPVNRCPVCGCDSARVYNPPQIIANPFVLREENRWKGSDRDKVEYMKRCDKKYEAGWGTVAEDDLPKGAEPVSDLNASKAQVEAINRQIAALGGNPEVGL